MTTSRYTFRRFMGSTALALVTLVSLVPTSLLAQTGLITLSPEEYQRIPTWRPSNRGFGEHYRVDLSRYLPAVGDQQSQGSCVGWAVAYACKSAQESMDQGWSPSRNDRVFSPAFIYNQINNGRDQGSRILDAIQLVQRSGCATLATMPYTPHSYTHQPSRLAISEAAKFKILGASRLDSSDAVRQALVEQNVVVIAVRNNDEFYGGRYDVFTAQELARGDARASDYGFGGHALCIMGYDDRRRAFKLINSWGKAWGKNGFCWVSYDLLSQIAPVGANFVREAWILHDEKVRVTPTTNVTLNIAGNHWHSGVQNGEHVWRWQTGVVADQNGAQRIASVIWKYHDGDRSQSVTTTDRDRAFQFTGAYVGTGEMVVTADAKLEDGSTRTLQHRFQFTPPEGQQRQLSLVQTDRYWGLRSGQPYWEWTLQLEGNLVDMADVRHVTYHLHPTFSDPNPVVRQSVENGFAMTTTGWGIFDVGATIQFKDDTSKRVSTRLNFRDRRRDEISLTNDAHYLGRNEQGDHWWNWTAFIDGPLKDLREIDRVTYHLHSTFDPPDWVVTDRADQGFPLSMNGWGTFTLRATVRFKNGSTRQLSHQLVFNRL